MSVIFVVKCQQAIMRRLQLQFDFDSTAIRLLVKGHCVHKSDVIRYSCRHADLFLIGRSEAARRGGRTTVT